MGHDYPGDTRPQPKCTAEQELQYKEEKAKREHEQALRRDVETLVHGVRGGTEPTQGSFEEAAIRLAAVQQKGDTLLEEMLGALATTTRDTVEALLANGGTESGDAAQLHTVEYKEDGSILIKNPSASVVIVSFQLQPSSAPELIRLAPGQTKKIQPTFTSRPQTTKEWLEEKEERSNNVVSEAMRDKSRGYGYRWNESLGIGRPPSQHH